MTEYPGLTVRNNDGKEYEFPYQQMDCLKFRMKDMTLVKINWSEVKSLSIESKDLTYITDPNDQYERYKEVLLKEITT